MIGPIFMISGAVIWAIIGLWGSLYEFSNFDTSSFNVLMQYQILREAQVNLFFFSIKFPIPNTVWFEAIGDLITLNYAMFEGQYNYIRILGLGAFFIGFVGGLTLTLFTAVLGRR